MGNARCVMNGAGGIRCSRHLRTTAIAINGHLRRVEICLDHYELLDRRTTALPGGEEQQPHNFRDNKIRRQYARQLITSCTLPDGTTVPWPKVREMLLAWGKDVPLRGGRLRNKDLDDFLDRVSGKDAYERELQALN